MANPNGYTRIPGRAGAISLHHAYLGADHLLAVQTLFARESYRRFFFRDIVAFSINRNKRRAAHVVVQSALIVTCAAFAFELWRTASTGWFWFFVVVASALAAALVRELVLGPTCSCWVRTAVQTVELPSINRVRRAMRARAILVERVLAVQGGQPEAQVLSAAVQSPGAIPVGMLEVAQRVAPGDVATMGSRTGAIRALGATAAGALVAAGAIAYDYIEPARAGVLASMAGLLAAIVPALSLLVLSRGGALPGLRRAMGWAVPGAFVVAGLTGYIAMIALITSDPHLVRPGQTDPIVIVTTQPPGGNTFVDVCYLSTIALFLGIAVTSAVLWVTSGADRQTTPPVSSS